MQNKIFLPAIKVVGAVLLFGLLVGCEGMDVKDDASSGRVSSEKLLPLEWEMAPVQEGAEMIQEELEKPAPITISQIVEEKKPVRVQHVERPHEQGEGKEKPEPMTISQIMDEKRAPVELFSFSAKGADIRDVLLVISKESEVNIVVAPEIEGVVTVDLKKVTLGQALNQLLPQYGLDYKREDNFVSVFKPRIELQTRFFTLNYPATKRIGSRTITASTGATNQSGGETGGTGGGIGGFGGGIGGGGGWGGTGSGGGGGTPAAGYSTLIDSDTADIWGDIQDGLEAIIFGRPTREYKDEKLSDGTQLKMRITSRGGMITEEVGGGETKTVKEEGQGKTEWTTTHAPYILEKGDSGKRLLINKVSGTIMVTDYPGNLNKVAEFLEVLEGAAHRQVVIRAKIVEVTLSDEYQLGIDWEFIQNELRLEDLIFSLGAKPRGLIKFGEEKSTVVGGTGNTAAFSDVIGALSKQGNVRVLSSPRIATLNNQKAIIKVARQDVFFTQSFGFAGGFGGAAQSLQPATVDIGIVLDVLPQIGSDGTLTMSIHPSVSEKVDEVPNPAGGTFPIVDIRETNTTVRIADGQTAIIGGLMREFTDEQEKGIPGLKSIPLLGRLFSHTSVIKQNAELVIMLTPTILVGKTVDVLSNEERERLQL